MFNILIVDDEPLVRTTFKNIINRKELDFTIIAEASNGAEALEKFREMRIDIVLTDIKMPEMDGLTLIKEIRKESSDVKLIVLSAYDEYHLVRDAFKYGAQDYFLKADSEPEELLLTLQRVCSDIDSENREKIVMFNRIFTLQGDFLKRLIWDRNMSQTKMQEMLEKLGLDIYGRHLAIAFVVIERLENKIYGEEMNHRVPDNEFLYKLLAEELQKRKTGIITQLSPKEYAILFYTPNKGDAIDMYHVVEEFLIEQQALSAQAGIGFSAGVSRVFDNIGDCYANYCDAMGILDYRFFNGKGKLLFCRNKAGFMKEEKKEPEYVDYSAVITSIREGNLQKLGTDLSVLSEKIRQLGGSKSKVINSIYMKMILELVKITEEFGIDMNGIYESGSDPVNEISAFVTIGDIHMWFKDLTRKVVEQITSKRSSHCESSIIKVKHYISINYAKKVKLDDIAGLVHLNPSYFSKLFTEKTGKNFVEYLNEIRVEKAKLLIANSDMKIYEISEAVGFESPEYFCRLFKKITGKAPNNYKKEN